MPDAKAHDDNRGGRHTNFNIAELLLQDVQEDADGNIRMTFHYHTRFEHVDGIGICAVDDDLSVLINRQSALILYRYLEAMMIDNVTPSRSGAECDG